MDFQEFWPEQRDLAAHGFDNAAYGLENLSLPRDQYQPETSRLSVQQHDSTDNKINSSTETLPVDK